MRKFSLFVIIIALALFSCTSAGSSKNTDSSAGLEEDDMENEDVYNPNMDPNVEKFCALTFDDGPANGQTDEVLDQLEKYKVPATFFIVGQRINDSTRKVLERAASLGCEFGNHSWDYSGMNTMSADKVKDYISKTSALIEKYTGKKPAFFRPPNLATSDTMFQNIELVFAGGVVCMDWEQTTTADQRAGYILNGAKDGAILLLHDVQPEPHPTPEALDIIIPELKARGYTFLTLSELFAKKGYTDLTAVPKRLWQYVK